MAVQVINHNSYRGSQMYHFNKVWKQLHLTMNFQDFLLNVFVDFAPMSVGRQAHQKEFLN
jgi:hypothetical protein